MKNIDRSRLHPFTVSTTSVNPLYSQRTTSKTVKTDMKCGKINAVFNHGLHLGNLFTL